MSDVFKREPQRPQERLSRALIAMAGGRGVVLDFDGPAIQWHVEQYSHDTDELGLGDAPDGLSIWEGRMGSVKLPDTPDSYGEWDLEVTGTFRPLTEVELRRFAADGCLWEAAAHENETADRLPTAEEGGRRPTEP